MVQLLVADKGIESFARYVGFLLESILSLDITGQLRPCEKSRAASLASSGRT